MDGHAARLVVLDSFVSKLDRRELAKSAMKKP
jgi:hypothetical protein